MKPPPSGLIRKEWSGSSPRIFKPPKAPHKSPNPRMRSQTPPKQLRSQTEFSFLRHLGAGANSEVSCVLRIADHQMYALKSTKPKDSETMQNIRDTIILRQSLASHPHLLLFIDSWEEVLQAQDTIHELYELADGTMANLLLSNTPRPEFLPSPVIWRYLYDIASGLEHIHLMGLIHGDIKPSNILYNSTHQLKIGDFGCLCHKDYVPDDKAGDSCYEAPECKFPRNDWSQSSDIYSFGLILFEMLFDVEIPSGEPQYGERHGKTFHQLMRESEHTCLELGLEINPSPPQDLLDLARQMLSIDPANRPTAASIRQRAGEVLGIPPSSGQPAPTLLDDDDDACDDFLSPMVVPFHRYSTSYPHSHESDLSQRKRIERPTFLSPEICLDDEDESMSSPVARRHRTRSISSPNFARRSLMPSLSSSGQI